MTFRCKNCGGNTVYSPEKRSMYCPFCDSLGSSERTDVCKKCGNMIVYDPEKGGMHCRYCGSDGSAENAGESLGETAICPNCNGEVSLETHTSATRCPSCDSYLILNERVEGAYTPKSIIPFEMGKETCKQSIREKFHKFRFAPTDFLTEAKLNEMQGVYVPFWLYDYDTNWDFQAEGTKVRSWTSGNTEYTETSVYDVRRNLDIQFSRIPVDASVQMPDDVMDLVEPYDYNQLKDFIPEYMSGFYAEKYNMLSDEVEERAKKKMTDDADMLIKGTYSGYGSMKMLRQNYKLRSSKSDYGLLPVWRYIYKYNGTDYPFYVNGQTGKIVGTPPISTKKVWSYTGTLWAGLTVILILLQVLGTSVLRLLDSLLFFR